MNPFILKMLKLICISFYVSCIPAKALCQFPPSIDLGTESASVTVYGAYNLYGTGKSILSCDINGDNNEDWIVVSSQPEPEGRQGVSLIEIFWGGNVLDSIIDLASYQGHVSRIVPATGDFGDRSVLTYGDFNCDGYDDITYCVNCQFPSFNCDGKAYIIFGSSSFPDSVDLENPSVNIVTINGVPGSDGHFGTAAISGDIDRDGYDDLIISAPIFFPGGYVYIIYGRENFPTEIDLSTAQSGITRIIDLEYGWASGRSLACGDVDVDLYTDILIGSPGDVEGRLHGKAALVFGSPNLPDTIYLNGQSPNVKRIYSDNSMYGRLGQSVAVGDVNKDYYPDLIVSAENMSYLPYAPYGVSCGEIYVIYFDPSLPDSIHVNALDIPITRIIGAGYCELYGRRVASTDLTGDQYSEIIITSEANIAFPPDVEKVTIIYGSQLLPDTIFLATDTSVTVIYGEADNDMFGHVLGAGDLNRDCVNDLFIGACYSDPLGRFAGGKAYLFYGIGNATGVHLNRSLSLCLLENYPNPFSENTTIQYYLERPLPSTLTIYNVLGKRIVRIFNPSPDLGMNRFIWDGLDDNGQKVASGSYYYRIQSAGVAESKKMIILK